MIFVVKTMEDVSPSLIAVLKRAKQIVGYEEAVSLIEESALPEHTDDVTVGMGVNGCTYKTLSPKQVLTKGTSLTFLTQAMNNAINHDTAQTVEMEQGKNYWVLETEDDVKKLWGYFVSRTPDAVSIDIETGGNADEEPWGVQWLLSISLTVDDAHTYVIPEELAETATTGAFIDALCNDIPVTTIGHNSTYDAGLLSHRLGIKVYFDEDTLMMHFCMNNTAQEHGLKPLAQRIFGAPDWDSANKKYTKGGAHFENIPRDQLYRYNAYDTYWTMRLYRFFREQMEHDPAIRAYYRYRMEVTKVLQDLQANGIVIDTAKLEELGEKFTAEFEEARGVLREVTGNDDFNPNSPKQVKDWLSSQGVPVHTADKEALTELLDSDNADAAKFASALLTFRRANKQYSTYVVGISKRVGEDGRIHPTYLPHGAKSGRLSSRNPNAQNITRDSGIKEAFVAPEGYCIVSCDYSQAELRTVAELAADEHMIAAFQPGAPDFFDNLMTKIYPEEFPTIETYEEFDRENHLAAKNKRAIIKGTVYGCVPMSYPILTKRGWLTYDQLVVGEDMTWGIDPETGKGDWSLVTAVNTYKDAPVYRYFQRGFDIRTTEGHKWYAMSRKKSANAYVRKGMHTIDGMKHDDVIRLAADPKEYVFDDGFTDTEVALLSRVLTDGSLTRSVFSGVTSQGSDGRRRGISMTISQAKPEYVAEIKALLEEVPHGETTHPGVNYETAYDWRIYSDYARALWDRTGIGDDKAGCVAWVLALNTQHQRIFSEVFKKAEGHYDGKTWVVTQKNGPAADAYKVAALLTGERLTCSQYPHHPELSKYITNRIQYATVQVMKKEFANTEDVWCPTTTFGTWTTMDERGNALITGNSNYGRGVPAIAKALKVPVSDAQAVMDSYYSTYPNLKKWQDSVREAVGKDRLAWRLITPFGLRYRQEVVTQRTRNKSENEALSFVPQSTANDICLHAAIEVNKRLDEYGARLVCSVHDALYVESPIDNAQAVGAMMEREMAGAAELVFHRAPFVAEAEYGNNFQEV